MHWLNYHHLLHFWTVAREGSIQAASEASGVTPASISVQLRQLERALGVALLEKKGRGLALTDMGRKVADYAAEIFAKGQELIHTVKGFPSDRPRDIRVGIRDVMPKVAAFRFLEPVFSSAHSYRVVCTEGEMAQLVADLAIHRLDLVLTDSPLDPIQKIQAYSHLLDESEVLLMGTAPLARQYRHGFPDSLDGAPFLLPTPNCMLRREMDRWFRDLGLSPRIVGEFADSAMLKIAGSKGVGLFPLPAFMRQEVEEMYGVKLVGKVDGVKERFFAVSVERKIRHPGVIAIIEAARSGG